MQRTCLQKAPAIRRRTHAALRAACCHSAKNDVRIRPSARAKMERSPRARINRRRVNWNHAENVVDARSKLARRRTKMTSFLSSFVSSTYHRHALIARCIMPALCADLARSRFMTRSRMTKCQPRSTDDLRRLRDRSSRMRSWRRHASSRVRWHSSCIMSLMLSISLSVSCWHFRSCSPRSLSSPSTFWRARTSLSTKLDHSRTSRPLIALITDPCSACAASRACEGAEALMRSKASESCGSSTDSRSGDMEWPSAP